MIVGKIKDDEEVKSRLFIVVENKSLWVWICWRLCKISREPCLYIFILQGFKKVYLSSSCFKTVPMKMLLEFIKQIRSRLINYII